MRNSGALVVSFAPTQYFVLVNEGLFKKAKRMK